MTKHVPASQIPALAAQVLGGNDVGGMVVASPGLYPHMWSWDTAFIAIGLSHLSVKRAVEEMSTLLRGQWDTGMIPHILYSEHEGYFPDHARWGTASLSPPGVRTSGICQPPVHAIALSRILERARSVGGDDRRLVEGFLRDTMPSWFAWHRWLSTERALPGDSLLHIHHSWESGMDNSPRWDEAYRRVHPGAMPPFTRLDSSHVSEPEQRPDDADYQRFVWLVDQLRRAGYRTADIRQTVDFCVQDVFFTSVASASAEALAGLVDEFAPRLGADELRAFAARAAAAVDATRSPQTGLARDRDARAGVWLEAATISGFAPIISSRDEAVLDAQLEVLLGQDWLSYPGLSYRTIPSTSPSSEAFAPKSYWRGPSWPVVNWLFEWSLRRRGRIGVADELREESLEQLSDGTFSEYYHPLQGQGLGSRRQSWTAAVALDWASSMGRGRRSSVVG